MGLFDTRDNLVEKENLERIDHKDNHDILNVVGRSGHVNLEKYIHSYLFAG